MKPRIKYCGVKKYMIVFSVLLMAVCFVMGNFLFMPSARAEETTPTSITEDLENAGFDFNDYPIISNDYRSYKIIQIAESTDRELYLYIYHMSAEYMNPTTVRIATSKDKDARWADYSLTHVSEYMSFHKYRVEGLTVPTGSVRYYDIPALHRQYIDGVDSVSDSENNAIDEIAIAIGQLWTATTDGDTVKYEMEYLDSVIVTDQYVGSLYYSDNPVFGSDKHCFSFYIAFNTNVKIDELCEADVNFGIVFDYALTDRQDIIATDMTATVHADDYEEVQDSTLTKFFGMSVTGLSSRTHQWNKIQTKDTFMSAENLTSAEETYVKDKTWVLRFYSYKFDTDAFHKGPPGVYKASDTTILRLKYITAGITYNVGVVSNKQTSSGVIGNDPIEEALSSWELFKQWLTNNWKWLVIGIVGVILLIVLAPFLPMIFSGIATVISLLFKGLWWLISAPFRLIYNLIHKDE